MTGHDLYALETAIDDLAKDYETREGRDFLSDNRERIALAAYRLAGLFQRIATRQLQAAE